MLCYECTRFKSAKYGNPFRAGKISMDSSFREEPVPLQDYQLIRVVLSETLPEGGRGPLIRLLGGKLLKGYRRKVQDALRSELAPLLDEFGDNYLSYGERLPIEEFSTLLPLPEFDAFENPKWIRRLLEYARHDDFIVLGDVPCLHAILCELAPRMRSLLWIAPDWAAHEQIEDFVEDFYQEYGLAINLQFVPQDSTYARVRIPDRPFHTPVNVLDFTRDKYLPGFELPRGSLWLDFFSHPGKEQRMESRQTTVRYLSLQKLWKCSKRIAG